MVVLGDVSFNVGAGMTGGRLYLRRDQQQRINRDYVVVAELDDRDILELRALLLHHVQVTGSVPAQALLEDEGRMRSEMCRVDPLALLRVSVADTELSATG